jgi:predicted adenylyl cyclase CyaB
MGQLSTNKPFETEVRFFIQDIDNFKKTVEQLGAELIREYSFTDYYFIPQNVKWNLDEKTLRIREWRQPQLPTAIWFTKQEIVNIDGFGFKRSLFPEGKVKLMEANKKECETVLTELGFVPLVTINKKHGWVWQVKSQVLEFCIEDVEDLGWSGEFELDGTDVAAIKSAIKKHQLALKLTDDQLSAKPIVSTVIELSRTQPIKK